MWENLKKQIVDKMIVEIKSKNNWDFIDELCISPFLNKINNHLNKYLILFLTINILIMILVIINILITLYSKK
jgi:hypothetical protein